MPWLMAFEVGRAVYAAATGLPAVASPALRAPPAQQALGGAAALQQQQGADRTLCARRAARAGAQVAGLFLALLFSR